MSEERQGIGMSTWRFNVSAAAINMDWRYLPGNVNGEHDAAWDMSPDYQRDACWSLGQKERFIGHVLAGGTVPVIYVQRYESAENSPRPDYWAVPSEVIDGKQRLTAIIDFVEGRCGARVYHSGGWHHYMFSEMSVAETRRLDSRVAFVDLSRADRLRFYLRLNGGGTAHTPAELSKVMDLLDGAK